MTTQTSTIGILDIVENNFLLLKKTHQGTILDVNYSSSFKYLLTIGSDNRILVWNVQQGNQVVYEFEFRDSSAQCGCLSERSGKYFVGFSNGKIRQFDLKELKYDRE